MNKRSTIILRYNDKSQMLEYVGVDYGTGTQYESPEHVYQLKLLRSSILTSSFFIDWGIAIDVSQRIAAVRKSFEFVSASMVHTVLDQSPWNTQRMLSWNKANHYKTSKATNAQHFIDVSTGLLEAMRAMDIREKIMRRLASESLFTEIQAKRAKALYQYAMSMSADAEKTREARVKLLTTLVKSPKRIPLIHGRDAIERKIIEKYGIKTTMRVGFFLFAPLRCFKETPKARTRIVAGQKGCFLLDLYDPKISESFIGYPICPMLPRSTK